MAPDAAIEPVPPEKVRRALHLLLFRRGRRPGARDWELRNRLGKDTDAVLARVDTVLGDLDLKLKSVSDPGVTEGETLRYLAVLKGTMAPAEARLTGWRIDSLAALAVALAFVLAKQGRVPREDLEDLVAEKMGRWRSETLVDAFVRGGYLFEDDSGLIALGWRTYAEVDLKDLVAKLLAAQAGQGTSDELDELHELRGAPGKRPG
jgi:hypothetical protein